MDEFTARTALRTLMENISERCYCAGWMRGLEEVCWMASRMDVRPGEPIRYGQDEITPLERDALRQYAERAGGWWYWGDYAADGPVFLTTEQWRAAHADHR